jgi:glyoxylate utilization-related uncharacterized protein
MRYFISVNRTPLIHESSGELLKAKNFIHQRRCIDTFVIIFCVEGVLHIAQDDHRYSLSAGKYLILFANHEHYGFEQSETPVTYYWCHFSVSDGDYKIVDDTGLAEIVSHGESIERLSDGGGGGGIT